MIKHICFDFDGVILDSLQLHLDTIEEAFGLTFTREQYATFLDGNFTDSEIGNLDWSLYHKHLKPKYADQTFTTEVVDSLNSLSTDYQLSINSTGGNTMLESMCEVNNVRNLFCEIWGVNTARYKTDKFAMLLKKYNLEPHEVLFVTDTLGDIHEAHEENIPTVAITGGYHDRARLESGNPLAIVDSWKELEETIRGFKDA